MHGVKERVRPYLQVSGNTEIGQNKQQSIVSGNLDDD